MGYAGYAIKMLEPNRIAWSSTCFRPLVTACDPRGLLLRTIFRQNVTYIDNKLISNQTNQKHVGWCWLILVGNGWYWSIVDIDPNKKTWNWLKVRNQESSPAMSCLSVARHFPLLTRFAVVSGPSFPRWPSVWAEWDQSQHTSCRKGATHFTLGEFEHILLTNICL